MGEMQHNADGRDLWNQKAAFWDKLHGDKGNQFHQSLVSPSVERLLDLQNDERVLDIGCGNGALARRLAELGAQVTAVDFSAHLIALAKKRGQTSDKPIQYDVVNATDEAALVALGANKFDAVVSTMAVMDMPTITPLFRAVRQLLKANGRFVFATSHPAFNSNNPVFFSESGDREGELYTETGIKLRAYLHMPPIKGAGARDEPTPHYYYHRPLHELLGTAFETGFVMDGIEEPAFPQDETKTRLSWDSLWQFPPVLTCRLRMRD